MLSYNESISICAQNENPFVENKTYNPDHVLGWIITHLLYGFAPANKEDADYLKQLYIATIQLLVDADMPVTEESVIKMREDIAAFMESGCPTQGEVATTATTATDISESLTKTGISQTTEAMKRESFIRFDAMGKSLTVKKLYVHIGIVLLIILLLIKIFK